MKVIVCRQFVMTQNRIRKITGVFAGLTLLIWAGTAHSQDLGGLDTGPTQVERVLIGPHPEYTRILINLDKAVDYGVKADFQEKKVTLILKNAVLGPRAHSRIFKDRNLEKVALAPGAGQTLTVSLFLKNRNSRFFHLLKADPYQIVIDIKGDGKPIMKAGVAKLRPRRVKIRGYTAADIREAVQRNAEERSRNEQSDYRAALKVYQKKDYPQAVKLFQEFRKKHPGSAFLSDLAYLEAEAEFKMAFRSPFPIYEKVLAAYNFALREYPDSRFHDHGLAKQAFIYNELGFTLEAKSLYESGLKASPKGLYARFRKTQLALLMLKENRPEKAYGTLKSILRRSPKDPEAQKGIFKIAQWYYDRENFARSLEIYEGAAKRWPSYLDNHPEIYFFMGEMYFQKGHFTAARKHYFELINLAPETPWAFKSLNRIGDTYFAEGNDRAALAVFDESAKRKSGEKRERQYARIRLADIGVRNPNLPVNDIIFDVEPYFQPFKTYQEIIREAADDEIAAQGLLSRGRAFLRGQQYIDAMEQFKKLLAMDPEKKLARQGEKFARQTLFLMIDKFSKQQGYLPVLYAYANYLGLNLGDANNAKTILQIGESYQAIGMVQEAVNQYERANRLDARKAFKDRIILNLGRIHLEEKRFEDAEKVARVFLNRFPLSNLVPDATKLLAKALAGQKRFDEAIATYEDLLNREKLADPSEIYYLMGEIHSRLNRRNEAIEAYRQVIETFDRAAESQPEYVAQAYFKHGVALYESGRFAEAVESLDRARQLYPNHPLREWAGFLIAEGHDQLQETKQARTELDNLAKSGQVDDLIKQAAESGIKLLDWQKKFKELL